MTHFIYRFFRIYDHHRDQRVDVSASKFAPRTACPPQSSSPNVVFPGIIIIPENISPDSRLEMPLEKLEEYWTTEIILIQ